MIFGIDLGTSNSLISLHSNSYISDLIPSCVDLETGKAGKEQYNNMSAKRSFKVDISLSREGAVSRIASKHVLEELKRQVTFATVKDVVISVPAYFSDNQRQATIEAATQAGLNVVNLVNEPTAAAMMIAEQKRGLYVVYDLGGGTFDVSIIDSRFGTFDVQATNGLKIGGDDFDKCIMRYFVKQGDVKLHKLNAESRTALQHHCTSIKVRMQKERRTFAVDLSLWGGNVVDFTPEMYSTLMHLTFQDTMTCLNKIVSEYIPEDERYEVLPVGGSTRCPFLREWLAEVTGQTVHELFYDPDKVVAQGAALYADMCEKGTAERRISDVTKQLSIGLADGTCRAIVSENSKIPLSTTEMFYNNFDTDKLTLRLYQGSETFAEDNELIGELIWDYGTVKKALDGQVIVKIDIDSKGTIKFSANELLKEPISIMLDRKLC